MEATGRVIRVWSCGICYYSDITVSVLIGVHSYHAVKEGVSSVDRGSKYRYWMRNCMRGVATLHPPPPKTLSLVEVVCMYARNCSSFNGSIAISKPGSRGDDSVEWQSVCQGTALFSWHEICSKIAGPEEAIQEWSGRNQNGGSGGPPPENFEKIAACWRILVLF
jgi:hypothetical protein